MCAKYIRLYAHMHSNAPLNALPLFMIFISQLCSVIPSEDNPRAFNLDSRIINFNMLRVSDAIHRRALRGVLSILITEHGNAFLLSEQQLFALRSRQEINGL